MMEQVIKFKAWNKTNKWMDEEFSIHADGCIYQPARRRWDIGDIAVETAYDELEIAVCAGLTDKNGKEIYYNGSLLRIKGVMGDNMEYKFDAIYKTTNLSFRGLELRFVKLFTNESDSIENSIPINQYPSFENGGLGCYENNGVNSLLMKDSFGENYISRHKWQEHHETKDIELIGNFFDNPELINT